MLPSPSYTKAPIFGFGRDKPEDKLLADCYRNALRIADEHMVDSIAFPAISTGYFGYPLEAATKVAIRTVLEAVPKLKTVKGIRFVLFGEGDLRAYEKEFSRL